MKEQISYDEFAKLDIRLATIVSVKKIKKSDKMLLVTVKVGDIEKKTVSGIGLAYTPEMLIGFKVAVVINIEPIKNMGIISDCWLLTAFDSENPEEPYLLTVDSSLVPDGSVIG